MRKRIVGPHHARQAGHSDKGWLDLEKIATVEVTSEDPNFPIEHAFGANEGAGWRASQGGEQQIRIIFDNPVAVHRMELRFQEAYCERTQEFILRWWSASGGPATEIVRQQWNFNPATSRTEIEDYVVDLDAVSVLELAIRPDLHRPEAVATLASWRVG
ncbi:MAG TPA: hypothetical protein VE621_19670 [Bryobacteraceae bacterium]|nr:hypothetical protein [Bryobacteraceae bacterium]